MLIKFWGYSVMTVVCGAFLLTSCQSTHTLSQWDAIEKVPENIRLLNEYTFPHNKILDSTVIGGLSDVDYNPVKNEFYFISDDRSEINPARFYTAKIQIADTGISDIHFSHVTFLRQANGSLYPNRKQDKQHVPDGESMRWNPLKNMFYWGSEGERFISAKDTVLIDPSVNYMQPNGLLVGQLPLPPKFKMHTSESGPRKNAVFEGLTFTDQYKNILVSMEEPLYQDGPASDTLEHVRYNRFIQWNLSHNKVLAEYAYHTDSITEKPFPFNGEIINGISAILSVGNNKVIVLERAYSSGHKGNHVKLYLADYAHATDVQNIASLTSGKKIVPMKKKLLFDFNSTHRYVDNIEGITFGPVLPNGHRTLLLAVDNNFNAKEQNQFYLFEIQ